MSHPRAGTVADNSDLVDVAHLVTAYYTGVPDPENIDEQVAFGTSGHRGSSLKTAFNETKQEYERRAERAKQLLTTHLGKTQGRGAAGGQK